MTTHLRHYVQPGASLALCGWQPTDEELKRLGGGWLGHPGWPDCEVCGDMWQPDMRRQHVR